MSGWDLQHKSVREKALAYIEEAKPDVVVACWPCSPWSPMQNLTAKEADREESLAKQLAEASVLLRFSERWRKHKRRMVAFSVEKTTDISSLEAAEWSANVAEHAL